MLYRLVFCLLQTPCCNGPELDVDEITRDNILLYDPDFTDGNRLTQRCANSLTLLLKEQHPESFELLPESWKQEAGAPKKSRKRKSRTR